MSSERESLSSALQSRETVGQIVAGLNNVNPAAVFIAPDEIRLIHEEGYRNGIQASIDFYNAVTGMLGAEEYGARFEGDVATLAALARIRAAVNDWRASVCGA